MTKDDQHHRITYNIDCGKRQWMLSLKVFPFHVFLLSPVLLNPFFQFNWKYAIEESTDVDCLSCHSREGRDSQTWLPISIILEKWCRKFLGPFTPYETIPPPSPLRWLCVVVLRKPTFRTTKRTMLKEDACQCFHRPHLINWVQKIIIMKIMFNY